MGGLLAYFLCCVMALHCCGFHVAELLAGWPAVGRRFAGRVCCAAASFLCGDVALHCCGFLWQSCEPGLLSGFAGGVYYAAASLFCCDVALR